MSNIHQSNLKKNAALMIYYQVFILLVPLVLAPYLCRVLGTQGVGISAYTFSIVSYFMIAVQLGVMLYGRREIARAGIDKDRKSKVFISIITVQSLVFVVVALAYAVFIYFSKQYKIIFIMHFMNLASALLDISWFYFGIENYRMAIARNTVVKLVSLIAIFIFVHNQSDLNVYIFIMTTSNLLGALVMWFPLGNFINIKKSYFDKKYLITTLKALAIMAIPVIAIQLNSMIDLTFLGLLKNVDIAGLYDKAYQISKVPVAALTSIGVVMLPRMTILYESGKEEDSRQYINGTLSVQMMMASACSFGIFAIAQNIIPLYLGKAFIGSGPILMILSFMLIFISWGNVFRMQFLLPRGLDKIYIVAIVSGAVIHIILNLLLIPWFGAIGAAISSLISEITFCVYQSYKIRQEFNTFKLIVNNAKYLLCGAIMAAIVMFIGGFTNEYGWLGIIIQVITGVFIYCLTVIITEIFGHDQILINEFNIIVKKLFNKGK